MEETDQIGEETKMKREGVEEREKLQLEKREKRTNSRHNNY